MVTPSTILGSLPVELQSQILGSLDRSSLSNLELVSRSEKSTLDGLRSTLQKTFLEKEGAELKKDLSKYLITVQQKYSVLCQQLAVHWAFPDAEYDKLLAIFNRYKSNCEKYGADNQVALPLTREDSWKLLFSIRNQQTFQQIDWRSFNGSCARLWGIPPNFYQLIDIAKPTVISQRYGRTIAKVYNTQIMGEFVDRFLESI